MRSLDSSRRWALVAVAALVVAYAYVVEPTGHNQNAHYLLTRSLAEGRATVDEVRGAPEALATEDVVLRDGHYYAAKPPGLALASQPAYAALERLGVETSGDPLWPLWPIWGLHLWSVVVPAALLLLLVMRVGERIEPRLGVAAAVTLGVATLVLPFATLFFSHILAACLGFAAFAVLWGERDGRPRLAPLAAAGLLAGAAVTVDLPLGLVAVVLGVYAVAGRQRPLERALAYAGGLLLGAAPLFLFNWWAVGSPLVLPYEGWHAPGSEPLPGIFGVTLPSLSNALLLIVAPAGLAALAPAVAGTVLLYRRGRHAEALVIGALTVIYVTYNAGFVQPFGGSSPGPRYLIPVLPFLAVPLALAYRALPGVTAALAAGATWVLVLFTITTPQLAWDGHALDRLRAGMFVPTVPDLAGVPNGYAIVPFLGLLAVAAAAAIRSAGPRAPDRWEVARGGVALAGWMVVVSVSPQLLAERSAQGSLTVVALLAAAAGAVAALYSVGPRRRTALRVAPAQHSSPRQL